MRSLVPVGIGMVVIVLGAVGLAGAFVWDVAPAR
jgi:hypothetical protein